MKKIESSIEYCNRRYEEGMVISLTVDEFILIRSNLLHAQLQLEDEIETLEWMNTEIEKHQLEELKRIIDEMNSIPF